MMQVCSEHCLATSVLVDKPDSEHQVSYPVHVIHDDAVANDKDISNVDSTQVANNDTKQDKTEQAVEEEAHDDDEHHNKVETMHEHKYNVHEIQPVVQLMVCVNEDVEDEKLVPVCVVKNGTMPGEKLEKVESENVVGEKSQEVEGEKSEEDESEKAEKEEIKDKSDEDEKLVPVCVVKDGTMPGEKLEKAESEDVVGEKSQDVEGEKSEEDESEKAEKEEIKDKSDEDESEKVQKIESNDKSEEDENKKVRKVEMKDKSDEDESEEIAKVESEEKLGEVSGREDRMEDVEKTQKVNSKQAEEVDVEKMEQVEDKNKKQVAVEEVPADEDEQIVSGKVVQVMDENMDEAVSEKIDVKEDEKVANVVTGSVKKVQDAEMKEVPSSGLNELQNDITCDDSKMKQNNVDKMNKMQEAAQAPKIEDVVCNSMPPVNDEDDEEVLTEDVARDKETKIMANEETDHVKLVNVEGVQASVDMEKPDTKSNGKQNACDDDKDKHKVELMEKNKAAYVLETSKKRERVSDHDDESSPPLHNKMKLVKRSKSTCAHTEKTAQLPEKVVAKKTKKKGTGKN